MPKSKLLKYGAILFLFVGAGLIGKATYIHAKAILAEFLLRSSWQETIEKGVDIKPWPWADTWPVARIMVPKYEIDLVVLEGDSGSVLAFGPGHIRLSSLPGQPGNSIISGHRDTSFRFLQKLINGDRIIVQMFDGSMVTFRVIDTQVIDQAILDINIETEIPLLTLVTCYPFDALVPGGSQRYLVLAQNSGEQLASH